VFATEAEMAAMREAVDAPSGLVGSYAAIWVTP